MTGTNWTNVKDALSKEIERCEELSKVYGEIPTGKLGKAMIDSQIAEAKQVLNSDNVAEMAKMYLSLQEVE